VGIVIFARDVSWEYLHSTMKSIYVYNKYRYRKKENLWKK